MSRNYKFHNPNGTYFVSFAVIEWIDVFSRNEYKKILLDSLEYCQLNKGMEINAWCIMTNHMHLVFRSVGIKKPQYILGDFKKFTSKAIVKAIKSNPNENRRDWLLSRFKASGAKKSNVTTYQFWRHDNHPIELWGNKVIDQKINYIHQNPVKKNWVTNPEEYIYSSAKDYAGEKGVLDNVVVIK